MAEAGTGRKEVEEPEAAGLLRRLRRVLDDGPSGTRPESGLVDSLERALAVCCTPDASRTAAEIYSAEQQVRRLRGLVEALAAAGAGGRAQAAAGAGHMNYFGAAFVEDALRDATRVGPGSVVIDAGAGWGASARTLAASFGCDVVAVEPDPVSAAANRVCNALAGAASVSVVETTFAGFSTDLPPRRADAAVAQLSMCHVADKAAALRSVAGAVRPGGCIVVEDFALRSGGDRNGLLVGELEDVVSMPRDGLLSRDGWTDAFAAAGLAVTHVRDHTAAWAQFTSDRVARHEGGGGGPQLLRFYDVMARALASGTGGVLDGVVIVARTAEPQ